jgi:hypothetical protein
MNVLPSWVKEYSTAMAFDLVTRLAINPVDSRLRRVLVSIRWETLPIWLAWPVRLGTDMTWWLVVMRYI